MLNLELTTNEPEFCVGHTQGHIARVVFPLAPNNISYGQVGDAASFFAAEGIWCTVFKEGGAIVAVFTKDVETPRDLMLSITPEDLSWVLLSAQGGVLRRDSGDPLLWSFRLTGFEGRIVFADARMTVTKASALPRFSAFGLGDPWQVGAGERWPEWAISLYDYRDTSGTLRRPRPVRLGSPVISTVPVDGDWTQNDTEDYQGNAVDNLEAQERYDMEQIKTGRAAPSRRIYFLAACDNEIVDQAPSLLIYLPSGMGTVRSEPVQVEMEQYQGSSRHWWCSYDFYQQNGLLHVDGYCYLSVHIPLSVVRPLPLRLRYKATGFASAISGLDDPEAIQQGAQEADGVSMMSNSNERPIRVGLKDARSKNFGT